MSGAELSRLKEEHSMAKAIYLSYEKRLKDALKVKKVKTEVPNRFIQKQLRRAS